MTKKRILFNVLSGAAIGVCAIIPGVSGGTAAVLLGVYASIIAAAGNLKRSFKESVLYLLPFASGVVLGIAAMYFPIKICMDKVPLATLLVFAGLVVGALPNTVHSAVKSGISVWSTAAAVIACGAVIGLCFIPNIGSIDLGADMPVYGYFLLLPVGAVAAFALVVPGISGSMLLLIFGYYRPILDTVSALASEPSHSLLVLFVFAVGVLLGLVFAVFVIKRLLAKYPKIANRTIVGLVVGSVPSVFLSFDFTGFKFGAAEIAAGAALCAVCIVATFLLAKAVSKRGNDAEIFYGSKP